MLVLLVAACGGLEPLDLDPISDEVDERPQISVDAGISAYKTGSDHRHSGHTELRVPASEGDALGAIEDAGVLKAL